MAANRLEAGEVATCLLGCLLECRAEEARCAEEAHWNLEDGCGEPDDYYTDISSEDNIDPSSENKMPGPMPDDSGDFLYRMNANNGASLRQRHVNRAREITLWATVAHCYETDYEEGAVFLTKLGEQTYGAPSSSARLDAECARELQKGERQEREWCMKTKMLHRSLNQASYCILFAFFFDALFGIFLRGTK
ncbi:hypothetical protein B0H63DRAFT_446765 [Podospora didyma]|uniref:Uncharacterized protein n=1 Tax=Podospora didyma TaxID=330526 RepID=A0AAE0U4G4_9PEZI|nr:hypothetical protein B0H63DRAFT_446765 [Podospora didyma]